jgi:hypothetical protein
MEWHGTIEGRVPVSPIVGADGHDGSALQLQPIEAPAYAVFQLPVNWLINQDEQVIIRFGTRLPSCPRTIQNNFRIRDQLSDHIPTLLQQFLLSAASYWPF